MTGALSSEWAAELVANLALERQRFPLGGKTEFVAYDQMRFTQGVVFVGYVLEDGVPEGWTPSTMPLDNPNDIREVSGLGGVHRQTRLVHGRRVSLAELAWVATSCKLVGRNPNRPFGHVVESAYQAGLLPRDDLMQIVAATPSAFFPDDATYRAFIAEVVRVGPLDYDRLLGLADKALTSFVKLHPKPSEKP